MSECITYIDKSLVDHSYKIGKLRAYDKKKIKIANQKIINATRSELKLLKYYITNSIVKIWVFDCFDYKVYLPKIKEINLTKKYPVETKEYVKEICEYKKYLSSEEFYLSKQWRSLKNKAKSRDNHKCVECGSTSFLQVHHTKYRQIDTSLRSLVTLCVYCHAKKHKHFDH